MLQRSTFRLAAGVLAAGVLSLAGAGGARAGQVISYTASPYMSAVNGVTVHDPFLNQDVAAWVGPINAHLTNAYGQAGAVADFRTYCVDLLRDVPVPSGDINILQGRMVGGSPSFARTETGPTGIAVTTSGGERAAYMYATFNPLVTSADAGIGLQLAIWSAIYNGNISTGDYGLKQGDAPGQQFWVAGGVSAAAYADALADLKGSLGKSGNADFWYGPAEQAYPGAFQWQIGGISGHITTDAISAPEPSTLASAGSGVAIVLLAALRRRRPAPAAA
jgi:hypothetical protein